MILVLFMFLSHAYAHIASLTRQRTAYFQSMPTQIASSARWNRDYRDRFFQSTLAQDCFVGNTVNLNPPCCFQSTLLHRLLQQHPGNHRRRPDTSNPRLYADCFNDTPCITAFGLFQSVPTHRLSLLYIRGCAWGLSFNPYLRTDCFPHPLTATQTRSSTPFNPYLRTDCFSRYPQICVATFIQFAYRLWLYRRYRQTP